MFYLCILACAISATIALQNVPVASRRVKIASRTAPRLSNTDAGDVCWEEDILGKEHFELTRAMCEKSISNVGDVSKLQRVVQKLADRRCVNVVAVGGSITCGHRAGKNNTYPQKLRQWLNQKFPCHTDEQESHDVEIVCYPGAGSTHWADQIASWRSNSRHKLWSADLVILDAAINDLKLHDEASVSSTSEIQRIGYYTELIVRQLLSSPSDPAIVYLEASFKLANNAPPFHIDSGQAHLPVLQYYDVTQVSVVNAFLPFHSKSRRLWLEKNFLSDVYGHPGVFGHKILAQLLIHALSSAGSQIERHSWSGGIWFVQAPDDDEEPPPLVVSKQVADQYAKASWLHLELTDAKQVRDLVQGKTSFSVKEDVPGKPGLLADEVGASVLLASAFERSVRGRDMAVNLGVLKSYDNTGVAEVTLKVAPGRTCSAELARTAAVVQGAMRVDCRWPETVSIKDVVPVILKAGHLPEEGCLFVNVSIVAASPPRTLNKIKLLDLTLSV